MKAREATLADKAATIELWKRCALTRPWNDLSRDFDFAHSRPASAVIVLESDGAIVGGGACENLGGKLAAQGERGLAGFRNLFGDFRVISGIDDDGHREKYAGRLAR